MIDITLFTATYNRGYILESLFNSLQNQTFKNFEWIVIDDGSTDNTKEIVCNFIKVSNFPIKYSYKNNEGKHIAINCGVQLAEGKWFFMVDSDDRLTDNALEIIIKYCTQIEGYAEFAGVSGLRGNNQLEPWLNWCGEKKGPSKDIMKLEYIDADSFDYHYRMKIRGDRAEVIRTGIIKQYPFPIFCGEKFMSEGYLWQQVANAGYKFRWFNQVIYITEYLADGLTKNIHQIYRKNWKGVCCVTNLYLKFRRIPIEERLKICINYYKYGLLGKMKIKHLFFQCNDKILSIPAILISSILYIKIQGRRI